MSGEGCAVPIVCDSGRVGVWCRGCVASWLVIDVNERGQILECETCGQLGLVVVWDEKKGKLVEWRGNVNNPPEPEEKPYSSYRSPWYYPEDSYDPWLMRRIDRILGFRS